MSYEKSPVVESSGPKPSTLPAPEMRETREVNPYRHAQKMASLTTNQAPTGQPVINSTPVASSANGSGSEEPVSPTEETVTLSPQVAALGRKEQRVRQQELDLKKRAEQLEADRAEIAELKALKAKLAQKDYSGIEDLVKYDDYTNYLIEKDQKLSPEQAAVKQLADEVEKVKAAHKEDVEKRFEAAVNERRKAVNELIETSPEFSKIKKAKMGDAVLQHILDTWEKDSKELSPEEAAKEVQQVLIERATAWKAILEEEQAEPVDDGQKQLPPLKPGIKTLTNNMSVTGEVKRTPKSFQFMSDTERYAEARRRAEEKLKQGITT